MSRTESYTVGSVSLEVIDNTDDAMHEMMQKIERALDSIGKQAEKNAKDYLEADPRRVDTGRLKNSITHTYSNQGGFTHTYSDKNGTSYSQDIGAGDSTRTVFIGTNVEYAVYVHEGTYKMDPNRFLKNAIQNHEQEYKEIAKKYLGSK